MTLTGSGNGRPHRCSAASSGSENRTGGVWCTPCHPSAPIKRSPPRWSYYWPRYLRSAPICEAGKWLPSISVGRTEATKETATRTAQARVYAQSVSGNARWGERAGPQRRGGVPVAPVCVGIHHHVIWAKIPTNIGGSYRQRTVNSSLSERMGATPLGSETVEMRSTASEYTPWADQQ